ncbi:hypothetical protein CERSUDRAFT_85370 [Gelatoporia subvermispora B]|uniref:Uncharacterized protein n=1 Tax=Ceriporiopsis subvermispora (strain B) TaxID=914234 RepID=M2QTJ1_CERS8|nr:hypothetical protein CERSUDRAFT_85370 [Gelatoporia subvermispora B]
MSGRRNFSLGLRKVCEREGGDQAYSVESSTTPRTAVLCLADSAQNEFGVVRTYGERFGGRPCRQVCIVRLWSTAVARLSRSSY